MPTTLIYDIETNGLLDDYKTIHCVVLKRYQEPMIALIVKEQHRAIAEAWAARALEETVRVMSFDDLRIIFSYPDYRFVAHNQLAFDLLVLNRSCDITLPITQVVDTLVLSRYLFPDRSGHSLEDWSHNPAIDGEKLQITNWKDDSIEQYLARCVADVRLNEQVYKYLRSELRDPQLHEGFRLAQFTYSEMSRQERTGILFDQARAWIIFKQIEEEMRTIAAEVEPQFGEAPLPKSKQLTFPKKPFKKNGELSATAIRYGEKLGITDTGVLLHEIERGPRILTAPVTLDNIDHVKQYLVHQAGWKPTMWRLNDITKSQKQRETPQKKRLRAQKYVKDVWSGPYRELIWDYLETKEDLRIPFDELGEVRYGRAVSDIMRRGKDLPMSPQIANAFKVMCPNLEKLQGDTARKIMRWMSLKNRHGVLDGWLHHPRLNVDSRLPAASSGVTNTHRQRHSIIVNLPTADEDTVYGKEIRSLFIAPPGMVFVGYDASGLEARIAGHLAAEFDNGVYAQEVLEGDIHTKNAAAYSEAIGREVTRKEGKSPTYALMYGCGKQKIATMFDVPVVLGQRLIDAFWNANPGLKAVMAKLTDEWEATGRQFVRTVDGRRVWTRSGHSLLNAVIQSTGAIIMDKSWEIFCKEMSLNTFVQWERVLYMHDEFALYVEEYAAKTIGEAAVASIVEAGKYYNLRVPLDGETKIGVNYADVH